MLAANWNRKELEEALAINSWRGSEHTEYSTSKLVEIAQNMNCKHPTVSSARLIQVTLERGRNLPTTPASASTNQAVAKANTNVDSNLFVPVAGVSPDTYVCIDLDGNEAQGQVNPKFTCFTGTKVKILTLTRLPGASCLVQSGV
jgi:hypothetical protein